MRPLLKGRDYTAVNDASAFDVFRADNPTHPDDYFDKCGLRLTYTVGQAQNFYAPAGGAITFLPQQPGAFASRTLVLHLGMNASVTTTLRMGGRSGAPSANVSELYYARMYAEALSLRLYFTITSTAVDSALRAQLAVLKGKQTLRREGNPNADVTKVSGRPKLTRAEDPDITFDKWFDGSSQVPWWLIDCTPNDDDNSLMLLPAGSRVVVQATVAEQTRFAASTPMLGGHEFLCNPGFALRALGVAGDTSDKAFDSDYLKLSGECVLPVACGGTIASGGTNPVGDDEVRDLSKIVVVYGGSKDVGKTSGVGGVVLQPPSDRLVPAAVYSFTSAEDVLVYSPAIIDCRVGIRLWQPTLDRLEMQNLQDRFGNVYVPGPSEVILATEYAAEPTIAPAAEALSADDESEADAIDDWDFAYVTTGTRRAKRYPKQRDTFLKAIPRAIAYDGSRARPPSPDEPFWLDASGSMIRIVNLHEYSAVRPMHPFWGKQRGGQIRRLFPLRIELSYESDPTAGAITPLCLLAQDDIDCVRQEYVFHLNWENNYHQTYGDLYRGQNATDVVHSAEGPRIIFGPDGQATAPSLGKANLIKVFNRIEVRSREPSDKSPQTSYLYTLLMDTWRDRLAEVSGPGLDRARRIQSILDTSSLRQAIRAGQSSDSGWTDPEAKLTATQAEAALTIVDLLAATPRDAATMESFLQQALQNAAVYQRFGNLMAHPYEIVIASAWRPPEHNESVSVTPNSNHQIGEAMDTAPVLTGPAVRNPLGMLAHHAAAQTLYPGRLREVLLEDNATEFSMETMTGQSLRRATYSMTGSGDNRKFFITKLDGTTSQVAGCGSGQLGKKLLKRFHDDYSKWRGAGVANPWPVPPPTYVQLYVFALTVASHVHLTWKRSP